MSAEFTNRLRTLRDDANFDKAERAHRLADTVRRQQIKTERLNTLHSELADAVTNLAEQAKDAYIALNIPRNVFFEQEAVTHPGLRLAKFTLGRKQTPAAPQPPLTQSGWMLTRISGESSVSALLDDARVTRFNKEHGLFLDNDGSIRPYYASTAPSYKDGENKVIVERRYRPLDEVGADILIPREGLDLDIPDLRDQPAMQYWTAVFEAVATGRSADNIAFASFLPGDDPRG